MDVVNIKNQVIIRSATSNDASGIVNVLHKTWVATYPNETLGITKEKIEESFEESLSESGLKKLAKKISKLDPNEKRLVAIIEDKIIGVATVVKNNKNNELRTIYVLPEFQNRGIGTLLWEEARKFCDLSKDIVVNVAVYNPNAIGFYKKLGFVDTGKRYTEGTWRVKSIGFKMPTMEMVISSQKH